MNQTLTSTRPCTAYNLKGVSFEEYLAKRIGWSVDRLVLVFDDFLRDIYDRTYVPTYSPACY